MKRVNPRHGSMQFWPRVRARRQYAKVRSAPKVSEAKLLGFAGYKAGMTHVIAKDEGKHSMTKGEKIAVPATVIEVPPLKISSVRIYRAKGYGVAVAEEYFFKANKELERKIPQSKNLSSASDLEKVNLDGVKKITLQVYTQPHLAGIGKKKPEIFELPIGGSVEEQLQFAKDHVEKEISAKEVLSPGSIMDARSITKGKGNQGPVKRFGIGLRAKKSEKTKRGPGSLGGWKAQGHVLYRIAYSGQMGYHARTQYSNLILMLEDDVEKVNPKGGFINYGNVKSTYILVKGSVPGPKKRLITLTSPMRKQKQQVKLTVESISTESKQGN
jgi:large subunit ribosomal protein L3